MSHNHTTSPNIKPQLNILSKYKSPQVINKNKQTDTPKSEPDSKTPKAKRGCSKALKQTIPQRRLPHPYE